LEKLPNLRGGGQDIPIVLAQVVEHTQEQDQEGITKPLFEILVSQVSVEVKGRT
jgi:hypothetical protein